jgi:hypothetical protein
MGVAVSGLSLRARNRQCQRPLTTANCGNTRSVRTIESRHLRPFFGSTARSVAALRRRPKTPLFYEPMFDCKQTLTTRLADAVDLMIDFATLGEYGLEPVGRTAPSCETRLRRPAPTPCSGPRRRGDDRLFDRVSAHYDF